MIIRVNDRYRITSHPSHWQVEELKGKRKDGSERWEPLYYHADFRSAMVSLAEYEIRSIEDSATVDEIKATLRAIRDECVTTSEVFRELSV
jgi:hypothetical protein